MRRVRIFVSSPGDAQFERNRLARVVERLNGEFQAVARLESIRWETEFYKAHDTFQAQIPEAAECDIVVAIFRARLGTELPDSFAPMPDGQRYPSGTAYEVLSAIDAHRRQGFPDVYVFRYPEPPSVRLEDPQRAAIEQQWSRLKAFFDAWFTSPEGQFKAALQTFSSTDEFERQAESLLRKWLEEKVLHGRSVLWPAELKGSPFRGLAAFGAKHAAVFFGRSRDIARAVDRLKDAAERACAFLLLDGASGAGKSSLARAGLVPRITAAGVVPSVDLWRVAVMRAGEVPGDPVAGLARRLFDREEDLPDDEKGRAPALPELAGTDFATPAELAGLLAHADATALKPIVGALDGIGRGLRTQEAYAREVNACLLLVVDQLDELFASDVTAEARERFVALLSVLARSGRVWVIATLRADLYERLLKEPALRALKEAGASYDLAPPEAAELAEIVRAPAQAADLSFEADAASGLRLDEQLLKDADRPDLLPLLQFTLNQLFEARERRDGHGVLTFAAYRALGGLEGAVDKEAERAIAGLDEAARASLPRLLRQLASPARASAVGAAQASLDIHAVPLAEAGHDEPSLRLVRALIEARILLTAGEAAEASVRLAHARVLESWQRAREVVTENAEFYRIRAEVEAQRRRWEAAGKSRDLLISGGLPLAEAETIVRGFADEMPAATRDYVRLSGRRARLRQRLVAAAAVVFAGVAGVAAWQWNQARIEKARAQESFAAAKQTVDALIFDITSGLGDLEGVRAESIQKILETVRTTIDQLAETAPNDLSLQRSRFAMLAKFGDVYMRVGDGARAEATFRESLAMIRRLLAIDPNNTQWRRDEVVILERLAGLQELAGDRKGALEHYVAALAALRGLVAENPHLNDPRRDLSVTLRKIGDLKLENADAAGALEVFREALAIVRELATNDPSNPARQNDVADCLNGMGDAYAALGDLPNAVKAFEEAVTISRALTASDGSNTKWQADLGLALERLADIRFRALEYDAAFALFDEVLALRRRLSALDPRNAVRRRNVILAIHRVAGARLFKNDHTAALALFEEALAIARDLVGRNPDNTVWQRDLARMLEQVGYVKFGMGDREGAAAAYAESLAVIEKVLARDPDNRLWRRDFALAHRRIGDIKKASKDLRGALAEYEQGAEILRKLALDDPGDGLLLRDLLLALNPVGDLRFQLGDRAGALAAYRERLEVVRRLLARENRDGDRLDAIFTLWNVARSTDDIALQRASLNEALALYEELDAAGKITEAQKVIRKTLQDEIARISQ